jgi:hypothetical protein
MKGFLTFPKLDVSAILIYMVPSGHHESVQP